MSMINIIAKQMNKLANKINLTRPNFHSKCIHCALLSRTLIILKELDPITEKFFAPVVEMLISSSKSPDLKGDYQNGIGRHYYCTSKPNGKQLKKINSYYPSGIGTYSLSSRVMFEENYTMALTFYHAGFEKQWVDMLGRAIHLLSDMCCLPHTSSMTYFSTANKFHKAYELLAESIYPDYVPMQILSKIPDNIFKSQNSFADDLNIIAIKTSNGINDIKKIKYEATICNHLYRTEQILCAFLLRFMRDTHEHERKAHFITNYSNCRLIKDTTSLMVKVTEEGLTFHGVNPSPKSMINVTKMIFYVAHRHDGLFTLSSARDPKGFVLEVKNGKLVRKKFNPCHNKQFFQL